MKSVKWVFPWLIYALLSCFLSQAAVHGSVVTLDTPTTGTLGNITVGANGSFWFTETSANQIGRVTSAGAITEFPVPTSNSRPSGITAGPDGIVWFTEVGKIGMITSTGAITEFALPNAGGGAITAGPDGNLWFAHGLQIGRITPAGVTTSFPALSSGMVSGITAGPDGNLWFVADNYSRDQARIGRITPRGVVTTFGLPPLPYLLTSGNGIHLPGGITAGADGSVWFTEEDPQGIGKISPNGDITEVRVPALIQSMARGPDGIVWFSGYDKMGFVTPAGVVTLLPTTDRSFSGSISGYPRRIACGQDGSVWFAESESRIGRFAVSWQAVDLAGGSDGRARILWRHTDGRMVLQALDNAGQSGFGPVYGPYDGFTASRLDTGSDGLERVLWNRTDGMAALWLMGSDNRYQASYGLGPYQGWVGRDITTTDEYQAALLWQGAGFDPASGETPGYSFLQVSDNTGQSTASPAIGPPPVVGDGTATATPPLWSAAAISSGSDGLTRELWSRSDGAAALWLLWSDNTLAASFTYGPYPGWTATDVAVGSDGRTRVLWTYTDGSIAVWSIDSSGVPAYGPIYGPYTGFRAISVAAGSDGLTRVLWNRVDGMAAIWLMGPDNSYRTSSGFGPY